MRNGLTPDSLERIVPDEIRYQGATGSDTLKLHTDRYEFAKARLMRGSVLDMACGVGYGTHILASGNPDISKAVGVDLSPEAIQYARHHYQREQITFICEDAITFQAGMSFDTVVSLETIEHVEDPRLLFANLVNHVTPGGLLIASVPVTPSVDANPHHRTNFTAKSFRKLAEPYGLQEVDSYEQVQRYSPWSIAMRREPRAADIRRNLPLFYARHPSHLALRIWSALTDGFVNRCLTVVWRRP